MNAIEKGFSVKKIDMNSYEFKISVNKKKYTNTVKKAMSVPTTKREITDGMLMILGS